MLRRFCALLLTLACAFAQARPAPVAPLTEPEDCCCGTQCPCPPADCALPANPAPVAAPTGAAAIEQRAATARPASQAARLFLAHFLALSSGERTAASAPRPERSEPDAKVALFEAHCAWRI